MAYSPETSNGHPFQVWWNIFINTVFYKKKKIDQDSYRVILLIPGSR